MTFAPDTAALRAYCNGAMAVSSLILIGIFVRYIIGSIRRPRWWRDLSVQAAGAITILMIGHLVRAATSWVTFTWIAEHWDVSQWTNEWSYFLGATILVLVGKILMTWSFSPSRWRWALIATLLITSLGVPALVLWVI
jgi:hypothetical protein